LTFFDRMVARISIEYRSYYVQLSSLLVVML